MNALQLKLDPWNPGQFFACCGLLEIADRLSPGSRGIFNMDPRRPRRAYFEVLAPDAIDAGRVLRAVRTATLEPDTQRGNSDDAAIRALRLCGDFGDYPLNWWLTAGSAYEKAAPFKLWAGQQTSENVIGGVKAAIPAELPACDLLDWPAPLSGRIGIDPRSSWNAQGCGYSPNDQGHTVNTFVLVEILGAVGLQNFRPAELKRQYEYFLWNRPLLPEVARAAAAGAFPEFTLSRYSFEIGRRGKYGYFEWAKQMDQRSSYE